MKSPFKSLPFCFIFTFFLLLSFSIGSAGDYQSVTAVKFRDGSIVQGEILNANSSTIKIRRPDRIIEVRRYEDVDYFMIGPHLVDQQAPPRIYVPQSQCVSIRIGLYSQESDELRHSGTVSNREPVKRYFLQSLPCSQSVPRDRKDEKGVNF